MPITSKLSGPTVAARTARRFRLVFADSMRRAVSIKRREAVDEYLAGWMMARIASEQQCGNECIVVIELPRPVSVDIAEQFIRDCPFYVSGTFAAVAVPSL